MNWSKGLSWLAALKARHELHFQHTDRADMGTAFGLDASIGVADEARDPAPALAPEATPQPWEHRLIRRSGL